MFHRLDRVLQISLVSFHTLYTYVLQGTMWDDFKSLYV